MLEDHASQRIYNSRITTVFHEFSRFSNPLLRMHQTLIFGQDVAKSKHARRVRDPWKIRLHRAWPSSILWNTTIKLLRITDQWYIVPVKLRFGRNRDFLALLLLPFAKRAKDGKRFEADWRLISSTSFHTSPDNCERNTQKWNSNNKEC